MPTEADRERAYETLAVANSNPPLTASEVGYLELVASPDPRVTRCAIALEHVKVRVGRFSTAGTYATSPDIYVAITDDAAAISPMNTMFEYVGGQFHAFDTRSVNGTFVNGEQIRRRRALAVGDVIDIGGRPEDGGARVVFHGGVAPSGLPIRRAPPLTRHEYTSPRGGITVEVDSTTGRGVARLGFADDSEWYETALDAARKVARVASPHLPATTVGDGASYDAGGPVEPIAARLLVEPRRAGAIVADVCDVAGACHPVLLGPFDRRLVFTRGNGRAVVFAAGISHIAYRYDAGLRGAMMTMRHFIQPPETIRGALGPPSDVWHAASFVVQLVTGREPFPTADEMSYWQAVSDGAAEVPAELPAIVKQALATDPQRRPTMRELAAALRRL